MSTGPSRNHVEDASGLTRDSLAHKRHKKRQDKTDAKIKGTLAKKRASDQEIDAFDDSAQKSNSKWSSSSMNDKHEKSMQPAVEAMLGDILMDYGDQRATGKLPSSEQESSADKNGRYWNVPMNKILKDLGTSHWTSAELKDLKGQLHQARATRQLGKFIRKPENAALKKLIDDY